MLEVWNHLQTWLVPLVPALAIITLTILIVKLLMRKPTVKTTGHRFRSQLYVLLIVLAAIVGLILTLPIDTDTRGQLLTLMGLLLTAIITLSSPTIATNAMAGFMLRTLGSYAPGDFIRVGEYFGRVTEQDLFHTEIQTEDRDLLMIPNLYLVINPVKVVHASGTIVSAEVSLGYDVEHRKIEEILIEAANKAELTDPFVYIMELGDFAVTYKISGFLANIKHLLSTRSKLRRHMMDCLHAKNIEIASPSIMNQRPLTKVLIPKANTQPVKEAATDINPEAIVFDKADRAQQIGELIAHHKELQQEINDLDSSQEDYEQLKTRKIRRLKAVERASNALEKQNE